MPFFRNARVQNITRFLMVVMLFISLGVSMDGHFDEGQGGDRTIAVQLVDDPSDNNNLVFFLPVSSALPLLAAGSGKRHPPRPVTPVQALYSPLPRPPVIA